MNDTSVEKPRTRAAVLRRWLALPGPTQWIDAGTVLVAVVLFVVGWSTLHLTHQLPWPLQPLFAAFPAAPILLLRTNPALGWAVSAASALIFALALPNAPGQALPFPVVHIVALYFLVFASALRMALPMVAVVWAATALLLGTTMAVDEVGADPWAWPVSLGAVVLVALLVRSLMRSRSELSRQTELSDLERARRTILEEKARIARDLHDVVAHHMSLVVVQAQTAPYRVAGVDDAARAEFESIGATARAALNEIRTMLGVLRSDGQLAESTPQPTATDLDALFAGAVRAGMDLTWSITGPVASAPDTVGLALYRIAQESLANAGRHAAGAPVQVSIDYQAGVELVVANGPGQAAAAGVSGGHGIAGMHARALAVGGRVTAEPTADGGFRVQAYLPVAAPPADPGTDSAPAPEPSV